MEWFIGALIPFFFGLWAIFRDIRNDGIIRDGEVDELTLRVMVLEQKIDSINGTIEEIKELRNNVISLQIDISKIITLLDERTT